MARAIRTNAHRGDGLRGAGDRQQQRRNSLCPRRRRHCRPRRGRRRLARCHRSCAGHIGHPPRTGRTRCASRPGAVHVAARGRGPPAVFLGAHVKRRRVAIVADFVEEGWPSMDLIADMLIDRLRAEHAGSVTAELVRPALRRRASRLPGKTAFNVDRVLNRFWDYPRALSKLTRSFDVFHIVDHSYAQLVHALPAERTLVTCHDLDTFRSVLQPAFEARSAAYRAMTKRILEGLRKAAQIACDTEATRDALVQYGGILPERTSVVHNGPHPSCTPRWEAAAEAEATRLIGRGHGVDLLHVGSTIERKRIDTLLRVLEALRADFPGIRLIRVGGPMNGEQRRLAR